MANVGYVRPEVMKMIPFWNTIKDCLEGEAAIKARGDIYLPRPDAGDLSTANRKRYAAYLARAVFYNVTGRTHSGLVGQVFQKDPVIELPEELAALKDDVDGAGVDLLQQAKKTLGFVLAYGRSGILADYPPQKEAASRASILSGDVRPMLVLYNPWQLINWRTVTVGARKLLAFVVISENISTNDDGFETSTEDCYRVLSLEPQPNRSLWYRVGIWRLTEETKGVYMETENYYPVDSEGRHLTEIPFQFVGSINNDPWVDQPPMYDIAALNIAHYRNSADYEESCYMCGQPTPVVSGVTDTWVKQTMGGKLKLGSRAVVPLPVGATATLLQMQPNSVPFEAMQAKERQMVALGAKLVQQSRVQRTATESKQEYATELSVLGTCAANVARAYINALAWCGRFAGTQEESTFDLAVDFDLGKLAPQELAAVQSAEQGKLISWSEARDAFKRSGLAYLEDAEARAEIDSMPDYSTGTAGTTTPTPNTDPAAEEALQTETAPHKQNPQMNTPGALQG